MNPYDDIVPLYDVRWPWPEDASPSSYPFSPPPTYDMVLASIREFMLHAESEEIVRLLHEVSTAHDAVKSKRKRGQVECR